MKTAIALLFLGLVSSAMATTYYIDYASGSDSNNGTSTNSPWKSCPGMQTFTGSYTHAAGDRFVFKGGVTWPNACFTLSIYAGSPTSLQYYGVDTSWYSGASWSRPIFDAQDFVLDGGGGNNKFIYSGNNNNVQIDNIEFADYYWNSNQTWGACQVQVGASTNFLISNCLFDKWTHDTYANGCRDVNSYCVVGTTTGIHPGTVVSNCVFDGSRAGGSSGGAVYCIWKATHCVVTNMSNGFLVSGYPGEVDHCWIGPINYSFDSGDHENSVESEGPGWGPLYIHHNIIDGAVAACVLVGDVGTTFYIYDNLIFNSSPIPIQIDSSIFPTDNLTAYIWNNTLVSGGGACVRSVRGTNTIIMQNNHFVGGGIDTSGYPPVSMTADHNYQNSTLAIAAALGFTLDNLFQPISISSPTVGAGIDLSSNMVPDIGVDLNGVARTPGAWDIGAYQYTPGSSGAGNPVNFTVTVVSGSGGGTYASNSVVNIAADSIAGESFANWSAGVQGLVADTNAVSTTVMVNANVTVTANYVTNPPAPPPGTGMVIPAGDATMSAPFVLSNGYISQPVETTDPAGGGEAIFTFTVTNGGNYIVQALVNAPTDANNSFFVNVDAEPVSPTMIWDTPVTTNFAPATVSWRGNGTDTSDQFVPKVFSLAAGTHQLIIRGREINTQLENVTILSYDLAPPPNLHVVSASP